MRAQSSVHNAVGRYFGHITVTLTGIDVGRLHAWESSALPVAFPAPEVYYDYNEKDHSYRFQAFLVVT